MLPENLTTRELGFAAKSGRRVFSAIGFDVKALKVSRSLLSYAPNKKSPLYL
jgi:hypothetical protein